VIQVSGELSNAGVPMRKFTQTFVLARQAPKKYSVFNDIFRYQDEMFEEAENDDTYEENTESENGVVNEMQHTNEIDTIQEAMHDVLLEPTIADVAETIPLIQETEFSNQYSDYMSQPEELKAEEEPFTEAEVEEEDESKSATGSEEEEKVTEVKQIPADEESSDSDAAPEEAVIPAEEEAEPEIAVTEETAEVEESTEVVENETVDLEEAPPVAEEAVVEQEPEPVLELEPSKPVTWAALAGKNTPAPAAPQTNVKPAVQKPPPVKKSPNPAPQRSAPVRKQDERPPPRKEPVEEIKKRSGAPPDAHQIFIGNLPPNVQDADIRNIFKEYGNIVEIRLNPKNFGFVAFDGPDPPLQILNDDKQFICNNNTINIEVKRSAQGNANRGGFRGNRGDGRGRDFNKGGRGGRGGGQGQDRPKNYGQRPRSSDGSNRTDGGRVERKDNRGGNNPREQRAPRR